MHVSTPSVYFCLLLFLQLCGQPERNVCFLRVIAALRIVFYHLPLKMPFLQRLVRINTFDILFFHKSMYTLLIIADV